VQVSNAYVLDLTTNTKIGHGLFQTIRLTLEQLDNFTFIAETTGYTSTVSFFINYELVRTERKAPYSCFGDKNGRFGRWKSPILDRWVSLKVEAVSPDDFMDYQDYWFRLQADYS